MAERVALVTGGSSGIGEETARGLVGAGFTTYAVARRTDRLAALEPAGVRTFAMDVTDDASMVAGVDRIVAASSPTTVARKIVKEATTSRPRPRYPVGRGAGSVVLARRLLPDRVMDVAIGTVYR